MKEPFYTHFEIVRYGDSHREGQGVYTWRCKLCRTPSGVRGRGNAKIFYDSDDAWSYIRAFQDAIRRHWRKWHFGRGEFEKEPTMEVESG